MASWPGRSHVPQAGVAKPALRKTTEGSHFASHGENGRPGIPSRRCIASAIAQHLGPNAEPTGRATVKPSALGRVLVAAAAAVGAVTASAPSASADPHPTHLGLVTA